MKHILNYTLKDSQKWYSKVFPSKKQADAHLKSLGDTVYWQELKPLNPKSKKPKLIVKDTPSADKYDKFTGVLETHHETGMECLGLTFYKDNTTDTPNPKYDPNLPEGGWNFKFFASYDNMIFIESGHIIDVNGVRYLMMKDRQFASEDKYGLSFYPQGFSKKDLMELFNDKTRAILYVPKK